MDTPGLLLYCRPGFEKECAGEISTTMIERGCTGFVKAKPDSGLVLFVPNDPTIARDPPLGWKDLVFARQMVRDVRLVGDMPLTDRATPLADAAAKLAAPPARMNHPNRPPGGPSQSWDSSASDLKAMRFSTVWLETADTNEAKELSSFCRKFEPRFRSALRERDLLSNDETRPRLHILMVNGATAYIGFSELADSAPWPMGIPRLRMPRSAASRSTLKLAEGFLVFLGEQERAEWLRPGLSAVDLGAAPGGWTWQLMRHGLHVYAIDNGDLDPELLANDQIEHLRADGLKWKPKRAVDWLVCDMVEKPARIAQVVADWFAREQCKRAIFNLKLPMKKRWEELQRCRTLIEDTVSANLGRNFELRFKQLYHDREEVTGYLKRNEKGNRI